MTGSPEDGSTLTADELAFLRSLIRMVSDRPDKNLAVLLTEAAKLRVGVAFSSKPIEERLQGIADQVYYMVDYLDNTVEEFRRRLQVLEEAVGIDYNREDGRSIYPRCKTEVLEVERNVLSRLLYMERFIEYLAQICGATPPVIE